MMEVCLGRVFRSLSPTVHVFVVNLDQPVYPKLKSLSFDDITFSAGALEKLLSVVAKMHGLDILTMRWCRVPDIECRADLENLVENVIWEDVEVISRFYETDFEGDRYLEEDSDDDDYCYLGGYF